MIVAWMASATLFTLLVGVAALAVERALRTLRRQARLPWLAAIAAAVLWPVVAPLAATLARTSARDDAPVVLPAVRSTIGALAGSLPPLSDRVIMRADVAVVVLWAIASVVLLARLLIAWRALSSVARAATRDVIAGVPVLLTPELGPAVFGVRRPHLLMPRWLLDLDAPLRSLVLNHEQEHCRARDPQLTLAVAIAVALVPWNAAAWWIARRLRLAMELDCDARVLRAANGTERYGRLLLLIAQRQSHTRLAPMLAESSSHLTRRIAAMNAPRPTNPNVRVAAFALLAVAALACSSKYATDLNTSPTLASRSASSPMQHGGATYYAPPGTTPARPMPHASPRYPDSLRTAHVEGDVLAQFVVDTSGRVAPGSLKVLRSSHPLFAESVREAVPSMRFSAAELNGRKVRQLVQQPFFFDVAGSTASAARQPVPVARPTSDSTNRHPMTLQPLIVTVP